jgi:hypothetical protein
MVPMHYFSFLRCTVSRTRAPDLADVSRAPVQTTKTTLPTAPKVLVLPGR